MDDCDIIRKILGGEIDRFEVLVEKYRRKIFLIVSRRIPLQDCEFVAQEAFIKAFRALSGFKLDKPFENWLITIAIRTCCDYWRKKGRENQFFFSSTEENHDIWLEKAKAAQSVERFESEVSRKETLEMLEIVMRKLSPEDRTLVELVYFEGWKLKDAAKVLDWKLSKTKVRAMRARQEMKKEIEGILKF